MLSNNVTSLRRICKWLHKWWTKDNRAEAFFSRSWDLWWNVYCEYYGSGNWSTNLILQRITWDFVQITCDFTANHVWFTANHMWFYLKLFFKVNHMWLMFFRLIIEHWNKPVFLLFLSRLLRISCPTKKSKTSRKC